MARSSRSPLLALVLPFTLAAAAFAADITGRWLGSVSTPNGDFDLEYNFAVQGETFTGALTTPGGDIPVENGRISGDSLSFTMTFGDNPIPYRGLVKGDTIVLTSNWGGQDQELVLTRAPAE